MSIGHTEYWLERYFGFIAVYYKGAKLPESFPQGPVYAYLRGRGFGITVGVYQKVVKDLSLTGLLDFDKKTRDIINVKFDYFEKAAAAGLEDLRQSCIPTVLGAQGSLEGIVPGCSWQEARQVLDRNAEERVGD
jgi:hypothetical protein